MKRLNRFLFFVGAAFVAFVDALKGRALATNAVMTPNGNGGRHARRSRPMPRSTFVNALRHQDRNERSGVHRCHGQQLRSADRRRAARYSLDAADVTAGTVKNIALFGLYPESIPAVASAAAITVGDRLVLDIATPGRVKTLPATGRDLLDHRHRAAPNTPWPMPAIPSRSSTSLPHVKSRPAYKKLFGGIHAWAGGADPGHADRQHRRRSGHRRSRLLTALATSKALLRSSTTTCRRSTPRS